MLEIRNARKDFECGNVMKRTVLDHLSLHLDDGEFVTIIGSNGAGKSTLFNAICGTFLLDEGSIRLDEMNMTMMPEHRRARYIGRVFQDPMRGTAPNMTVEENLSLAHSRSTANPLSFAPTRQEKALFRDRLSEFGMQLEDRMKTKVGLLSGGQRQAVTLLMCTIVTPRLLLLDEHTAALDPGAAAKVMEITRKIVSDGHLTTMMITHNMSAALTTGTRTLMMENGKILFDLSGEQRANMTTETLLDLYSTTTHAKFDNDRMLFEKAGHA
ncbi:MAG: ATP-binding cassette domain-containing protein [Clostridia bacterium]|nr:ATP-binding cassette domain-containing protein [Clostridia bacterium]